MKAVLFYGVRLPIQQYQEDGRVETDYELIFDENFVGSEWELHTRQYAGAGEKPKTVRFSAYLSVARLTAAHNDAEPFKMVHPRGIQDQKITPSQRDELKDILSSFGVDYVPPKWFLTCSE